MVNLTKIIDKKLRNTLKAIDPNGVDELDSIDANCARLRSFVIKSAAKPPS